MTKKDISKGNKILAEIEKLDLFLYRSNSAISTVELTTDSHAAVYKFDLELIQSISKTLRESAELKIHKLQEELKQL